MLSVNPHGDHINTYNMIKWTLLKMFMQLKMSQIFINQKIN